MPTSAGLRPAPAAHVPLTAHFTEPQGKTVATWLRRHLHLLPMNALSIMAFSVLEATLA